MNKRNFLTTAGIALAAAGVTRAEPQVPVKAPARPKILWIMTDQQPADMMSCAGNANLRTPAMDSIATNGVRFELAYTVNPICVPSRTSMMTGRLPHETGVKFNLNRFDVSAESLGARMKQAGYDTAYMGKWHIPMETKNSKWHGFDVMMDDPKEFNDEHLEAPLTAFIKQKRDKPFFLVASFTNPHDICEFARKLANFGKGEEPKNGPFFDPPPPKQCPSLPANFAIPQNEPNMIRVHQSWQENTYPARDWTDGLWRQYRWELCRLTELVDSRIATLLDALRAEGLMQNTLIVLVSDHGDGNAAHHWNQKTLFYDETARVPLILSGPGIAAPGRTDREHLVSTGQDLFPTFCDYAGIETPETLRGRSLRPLAEGRATAWRNQLVAENDLSRRFGLGSGVEGRMLRTQNYKYVVYSYGKIREQLTDMRNDPGEMNNLAVDPKFREVLQEHRNRLAAELKETGDFFNVPGTDSAP